MSCRRRGEAHCVKADAERSKPKSIGSPVPGPVVGIQRQIERCGTQRGWGNPSWRSTVLWRLHTSTSTVSEVAGNWRRRRTAGFLSNMPWRRAKETLLLSHHVKQLDFDSYFGIDANDNNTNMPFGRMSRDEEPNSLDASLIEWERFLKDILAKT